MINNDLSPSVSAIQLHLRSYDKSRGSDRHAFAQLVLPMTGQVELEIGGKHGVINPLQGGVVAPQTWHSQSSSVSNHSIIVDMDATILERATWSRLLTQSFVAINPGARKLIEYIGIMAQQGAMTPLLVQGWVPIFLDTLVLGEVQISSRLGALLSRMREDPGLPWSTQSMAHYARISVSRLHAIFRDELQTSPHAWLLQQRINHACHRLAQTNTNVADIALASGFSDQSALTRAMRDSIDCTPAVYRRQTQHQRQENKSKKQ